MSRRKHDLPMAHQQDDERYAYVPSPDHQPRFTLACGTCGFGWRTTVLVHGGELIACPECGARQWLVTDVTVELR